MTELERRALMGDKQAQHECTQKGIILPCLKCYGKVEISSIKHNGNRMEMGFKCKRCGLEVVYGQYLLKSEMDVTPIENPSPLAQWNDRHAPPIGKCGECESYNHENGCCEFLSEVPDQYSCGHYVRMYHDDFCNYFVQKERE